MKNIFITGGTGKIGKQLSQHFIKEGWNVVITTRNLLGLDKIAAAFDFTEEQRSRLYGIKVDFNDTTCVDTIKSYFVNNKMLLPHVLVNNARTLDALKVEESGFSHRSMLMMEYLIDVVIPYEISVLIKSISPQLSSIINVSSIYGLVPFNPNLYDNYPHGAPIQYSLAKASVIHLSKELSIRFKDEGIRVNTVSYGGVEGRVSEEFKNRYATLCPEGVMLKEDQTIGPVHFLATDLSKGITGQNIVQDGGWTTW